ncbi:MAG: polysulfide reductase [Deltaproteobacteria bacterium]|nr:polysulfide reductase [Deltaproteobacteria bacterium]
MSPETLAPEWAWYYVALYFFIAGTAAGAYFTGTLAELFGGERLRQISRLAFYITLPLLMLTPILLIADLGRPERFWHLFFYTTDGIPYINLQSPLSVGSWALMVFGGFALLSFLDNLIADGHLRSAPFAKLYNRLPRKLYALAGSIAGFFVAGYTGVLLNVTARPLWEATDPLLGALFVASGGSTGVAAILLVMSCRKTASGEPFEQLEAFDRLVMILELLLIVAVIAVAGQFAAPLLGGFLAFLFWVGAVLLGICVPFGLNWHIHRTRRAGSGLVLLSAVLVLIGGALLRIVLLQAGLV